MSARLLSARLPPAIRAAATLQRANLQATRPARAGGLIRSDWNIRRMRQPKWPHGFNGLHNVPAVRSISFARIIPSIVTKMARLGAVAGGATVAGLSYIQYQAGRTYLTQRGPEPS
jgi:dynamin-like GTPase MGM1, mitochondrial